MPYDSSWVEPEQFLTYKGVDVFHTYRDNDINSGQRSCWFTTSETCGEIVCGCDTDKCHHVFDVRCIPVFIASRSYEDNIKAAIDAELLTTSGHKFTS